MLTPSQGPSSSHPDTRVLAAIVAVARHGAARPRPCLTRTPAGLAAIGEVVRVLGRRIDRDASASHDLKRPITETAYQSVRRRRLPAVRVGGGPSLQRLIGRSHDENLHSDFLAALLRTATAGDLARQLFIRLFSIAVDRSLAAFETSPVTALREVRIDQLVPASVGSPVGARRLDILARCGKAVLVIESKVWTDESDSQTADYRRAVEARYGHTSHLGFLLLSPDGRCGRDRAFRGLSFMDLYDHLIALDLTATSELSGKTLLSSYSNALREIFVEPALISHERSKAALRQEGYRV